ncbi:MAG: hypothetical protein PHC28_04910 [Flavobacterium sp.]|uniref:hypothetical protein n=1 Tax=Flavobacterium sp. TaxID=239 RepID=UPI002612DDF1|nr:hypothetical protein [Flavobacterium sp.]MDD5149806.1 hypothetical protein [Flavobacterium sp.]
MDIFTVNILTFDQLTEIEKDEFRNKGIAYEVIEYLQICYLGTQVQLVAVCDVGEIQRALYQSYFYGMQNKPTDDIEKQRVIDAVNNNHIGITISTENTKEDIISFIGSNIIDFLNDDLRLIPKYTIYPMGIDNKTKEVLREISNNTKTLYLSITRN